MNGTTVPILISFARCTQTAATMAIETSSKTQWLLQVRINDRIGLGTNEHGSRTAGARLSFNSKLALLSCVYQR
eukprot:2186022-Amphidinium_carterae.1